MDWSLIALVVVVVLAFVPFLWRLALREVVRSARRRYPAALTFLRVGYWTVAMTFYGGVLLYAIFYHGGPGTELLVYGFFVYVIAAGMGYRLLLRLGYLVTDSEAYEEELRDSEERVELGLGETRRH